MRPRFVHRLAACALASELLAQHGFAACSVDALVAVQAGSRSTAAPGCGTRRLRRSFVHARNKIATVASRAARECARGQVPRVTGAHVALAKVQAKIATLDDQCRAIYDSELTALVAALDAAATGSGSTTTTTSPPGPPTTTTLPGTPTTTLPGTPTTTLPPTCAMVQLEIDKGDCLAVTSIPAGLVHCGPNCDLETFTVPATGTLRLTGTPAPGDVGVTFDTDCDDDGTVPLDTASPPDCSLSCDCSSGS